MDQTETLQVDEPSPKDNDPRDKKNQSNKNGKSKFGLPKIVPFTPTDIRGTPSILGSEWSPVYTHDVDFGSSHFEKAFSHLIQEPNINSTSIMRTDILSDNLVNTSEINRWLENRKQPSVESCKDHNPYYLLNIIEPTINPIDPVTMPLSYYLDDVKPKKVNCRLVSLEREIVRRLIPRNPLRDPVLNQSCIVLTHRIEKVEPSHETAEKEYNQDTILVVYLPHIMKPEESPFYLPPAYGVGILYHNYTLSVHYLLYDKDKVNSTATDGSAVAFSKLDPSERIIRIAHHLAETAFKHSCGAKSGYKKRVHHDLVVPRVVFQDRYIDLKNKYSKELVNNWVETTDPRKHVFEDLAIAAFIIELWNQMYTSQNEFSFVDVGCGNGLLVNILIKEGYKGYGIEAKARKSWETYSPQVQNCLKEQVIIPKIILDNSNPEKTLKASSSKVTRSYKSLYTDSYVNLGQFPTDTFIIGNHPDELTLWIPFFDRPFLVIPCCSHALSGAKHRFPPKNSDSQSTYASLVDHVDTIATRYGWVIEKEVLRIPSTRSTALIGRSPKSLKIETINDIINSEGGTSGWIDRVMALKRKGPRNH